MLDCVFQQSMQDQFDRYGPTLHMGKISSSDFNYPDDFHLFTTPGRNQDLLIQSGFYLLVRNVGSFFPFASFNLTFR